MTDAIRIEDVDNLGAVINRLTERIADLEDEVEQLRAGHDLKARAERVVEHADRLRRNGEDVALNYRELAAITGTSLPTAYKDFERLPDLHPQIHKHEGKGSTKLVIGLENLRG